MKEKGDSVLYPIFYKRSYNKGVNTVNFLRQIFILVLILINFPAIAQWDTQSPVPTHLDVRGIGAPTVERVFLATSDDPFDSSGALFESMDGGTTWDHLNVPFSLGDPFNGIFFLDSQNGWVYGNDNYRTIDGGTTWTQLQFLGSTYFMEFYTTTFGLATGNFGRFVSYDSGDNWVESPGNMFAFDFFDNQLGLGIADSAIYRTTDGGTTFTQVYIDESKAVAFLSSTVAVGIVSNSFVRSTDGGVTWTVGAAAEGKHKLVTVSPDLVLAWGRTGTLPNFDDSILRSTDGGQTWTNIGEPMPEGILALTVVDAQTVVASDLKGNMFRTSDAGLNWTETFTSPGPQPGFLGRAFPVFPDPLTGYFGYGAGFVIKTTDAGQSWSQISSGTGHSLNDIARFASGDMITVGDNGTLLTSNGSSPWIIHEAFTTFNIAAVQALNTNEAVVVDETGQVYISTDGGLVWSATAGKPSTMSEAEDIHFTTLLDGWVIGFSSTSGALYHTTDAGATWTTIPDFQGAYVSVDVEGSNIWAANVTGRYYRSNDNGLSWIQGDIPGSTHQIQDMDFFDENIGYAVGWWGQAFRSDDGGVTWQILPTPNNNDYFTDIYLLGPNEFWLSTNSNTAYYSSNGGLSWAVLDIGSKGFGNFSAIVADSPGNAWTVGMQGYIEHFNGPPPPPLNQPPTASFDYIADELNVNFFDTSTDFDGTIVAWAWDFGDSTFSTEQNPSHTYLEANTYIVQLVVTDDDGATDGTIQIIIVQPNPGGTFGDFTEVTPLDSLFVTPPDEDFWVITTAPADYDNDGDLDIAVLGYYVVYNQSAEDRLVLLRNEGLLSGQSRWGFSYIDVPLGTLSAGASDLAWGDVDGDGDQDLAVGTDGATVIYRNDAGTLSMSDTQLPGYWEDNDQADFDLRSLTWADYDNDGDLDLLIPSVYSDSTFSFRTALMRNDGSNGNGGWIFTETDSVFAPTIHAQSSWADYDGDQDLDLLLVNVAPLTEDGFIRRYRNDGNGIFVGEDILGNVTIEHGEAQWGDYDADGDLDILVAGLVKDIDSTYNLALRIYRNDNEIFNFFDVIPCIPCEGWIDLTAATWADYDSDGDMDILLAGSYNSGSQIEGRARIYINDNGIFTESGNELPAPRASGTRGGTFSWFDIDGEGDLDYFIAGQYFVPGGNGLVEAQMHVYRNDTPAQNNPPSTPTGLHATLEGDNSVILTWIAADDDHTSSTALTYDLVVVRKGKHVPSGKLLELFTRLPEPGNVSAVTEWSFAGLEDGQYEWRLRSVDAAYVGSETAIGTFGIGVTSIDDLTDNLPDEFSIGQNYPNPFNPVTTIKYSIPKEGLIKLIVYNAIGEEVAKLVNEIKTAGNYNVSFDASSFSSGVYFYRLEADSFVETKKMILIK